MNEVRKTLVAGLVASAFAGCLLGGCVEEPARPCLGYDCTSSATLNATIYGSPSGELDYSFCHGNDCRNGSIVKPVHGETCSSPNPESESVWICIHASPVLITPTTVKAHWVLDREGIAEETTFRINVIERSSGEVVLDETAAAEFGKSVLWDDCHDCRTAEMNVTSD